VQPGRFALASSAAVTSARNAWIKPLRELASHGQIPGMVKSSW